MHFKCHVLGILHGALINKRRREKGHANGRQRRGLHSRAAGLIDDNRFPCLIHIVVQPEVSCHTMDEHPLIGGHLRELFIMITEREDREKAGSAF